MESDARATLGSRVAVVALVTAAALPLGRLFTSSVQWLIVLVVGLALLTNALSRRLRLAPILDLFLTAFGLLWLTGVLFLRDTLAFGVLPAAETWRGIQRLIGEGSNRIIQEVAPIAPGPEILLFVVIGIWATAWLVDTAAASIGSKPFAIIVALPLLLTPGLLVSSRALWWDAGLFIAAAAAMLWLEQRTAGPRTRDGRGLPLLGPLASLGIAGLLLVALVPRAPGFGQPSLLKSRNGGGVAFNPITALRPTLSDDVARNLLFVTTLTPGYLRLTTLDQFDGEMFTQSGLATASRRGLGAGFGTPYDQRTPFVEVEQRIQLTRLAGSWLPAQPSPILLEGLGPTVQFESDTGALVMLPTVPRNATYRVVSMVAQPNGAALDALSEKSPSVSRRFLDLPKVSSELRAITAGIVGDAETPYRKAVAIQRHLRGFTYDLRVAADHDLRTMEQFLTTVRRGYCEQFATTMAVLARIAGLPSRVVIGFANGTPVSRRPGGATTYLVTTLDAHAWPEIWIEGAGWIAFEPTPRAGVARVPAYTVPGTTSPNDPTPIPTTTPTVAPTSIATPTVAPTGKPSTSLPLNPLSLPVPALWSLPVFAGLILALRLIVVRRGRRPGRGGMPAGYRMFLRYCGDAGLGRRPGETPSEHAERLTILPGIEAGQIRGFVEAASHQIYGRAPATDLRLEGQGACRAVGAVLPRRRRVRAVVRANLAGPSSV